MRAPTSKRSTHARHAARRDSEARRNRDTVFIYGIHAVQAALANPKRTARRLLLTDNAERRLRPHLEGRQLRYEHALPKDLARHLGPDAVHQGAMLEADPLPELAFEDLVACSGAHPLIVLDRITDPHNVGAILRSAAAFGAGGLIMTRRHSPPLDGALAKSASGALEHVPVVLAQNLARAIAELKKLEVTVIGLDGDAPDRLETSPWPERLALVLGAEGKGLRQLTRASCDRLARISTSGSSASLNVSNAAAVALHWVAARRQGLL